MDFQDVDLKQVVKESVETFRLQAAEKAVALESLMEVPEEVSCTVWGDETRLHQILDNLLSNALKFTPGGGLVTVQFLVFSPPLVRPMACGTCPPAGLDPSA